MAADLAAVENLSVTVLDVTNDFFGGGVSVSGLLTGQDVVASLRATPCDLAVLPRSAFGYDGRQTLDGWTTEAIEGESGVRLALATAAAELLRAHTTRLAAGLEQLDRPEAPLLSDQRFTSPDQLEDC